MAGIAVCCLTSKPEAQARLGMAVDGPAAPQRLAPVQPGAIRPVLHTAQPETVWTAWLRRQA